MTLQFGMGIRLNLNQYIRAEGAKLTAFWGNAEWHKDAGEGGSASQVLDAEVRFLSVEPLLEHMGKLDLRGIHWMMVGGESGVGARPMKKEWVLPSGSMQTEPCPFLFQTMGRSSQEEGRQASRRQNL
jgi:protein gp37